MVVEYIRYTIAAERSAAFEAAYQKAQAQLRLSPHCTGFELSRCEEEPTAYILRITWTSTKDHLEQFRGGPDFAAFVAHVRPFIGDIEEMRHYVPLTIRDSTSIAESAGGEAAFCKLAEAMHRRMSADDLLGPWFSKASASHVPHLAMWLTEVFGGPGRYSEAHGDIAPMLARHANLDISEAKRARFAALAREAAEEVWPDRPDVVRAVARYVDWGTTIAVENSKPGHVPDPQAGVPTWGWSD